VTVLDQAGPVHVGGLATSITAAGFSISTPILTTAHPTP
jgi:hypothetical protein